MLRIRYVYPGSRIRIFPPNPGEKVSGSRIQIRIKEFKYGIFNSKPDPQYWFFSLHHVKNTILVQNHKESRPENYRMLNFQKIAQNDEEFFDFLKMTTFQNQLLLKNKFYK